MKLHVKRKFTRRAWKELAQAGHMNRADGSWGQRGSMTDNAMKRDFSPQAGSVGKSKGKK